MEDILASIRRILSEDEQAPGPHPSPTDTGEEEDDVLELDSSMVVNESGAQETPEPKPEPAPTQAAQPEPVAALAPMPEPPPVMPVAPLAPMAPLPAMSPTGELVGPEAADAAASSVGSLVRTLAAERTTQVYGGGPTIEDLVRAELRPMLRQWLDAHLPGLVERLVRAEIERVVGRAVP